MSWKKELINLYYLNPNKKSEAHIQRIVTLSECQNNSNRMELEDNARYQLMAELMSQIIELTNLVEKLTAQQELQHQTIKSKVVEPPSPPYKLPQITHLHLGQSCTIDLPRALYLMIYLVRRIIAMRPKISTLWQVQVIGTWRSPC